MAQVFLNPGEKYVSADPNNQIYQLTSAGPVLVGSGLGTFTTSGAGGRGTGTAASSTTTTSSRTPPSTTPPSSTRTTPPSSTRTTSPSALTPQPSAPPVITPGLLGPDTAVQMYSAAEEPTGKISLESREGMRLYNIYEQALNLYGQTGDTNYLVQAQQVVDQVDASGTGMQSPIDTALRLREQGYIQLQPDQFDTLGGGVSVRQGTTPEDLAALERARLAQPAIDAQERLTLALQAQQEGGYTTMRGGEVTRGSVSTQNPDGSITTRYADGRVVTTPPPPAGVVPPPAGVVPPPAGVVPPPGGGLNVIPQSDGASQFDYINALYRQYLGRDASIAELQQYASIFGPTIEPNEIEAFIRGGVTSGEITQARADELLASLTGGVVPPPGGVVPPPGVAGPLPSAGETNIDPLIAPYLQEALERSRSLFLGSPGPQLYPEQMYVSPSEQTLQALQQAESIVTSPQAQQLSQQGLEAYGGALGGLQSMARGDYLQSPEYQRYLESVTRPVTEQLTQQILPSIASQYSAAGRYGSGAMQQATGKATELGTRALGDITAQVAQQQQGRMLEAQTSLPSFLGAMPSVLQGSLAPSTALAGIGGQREAIAAQPLQERIQRFEYGQQLPYSQLAGYLSSIYGSPLANYAAPQQLQGNTAFQNIGGALQIAGAIPGAVQGVQAGISGARQGINWLSGVFS